MADVVVRCLAALFGSATLIGVGVAAGLLAARTELTGAVIHAAGITCVALTFATTALLAAQVMPTRSGATGLTVAALGVALMLRMIADGSHQLAWSAWATPFGLTARSAPYAENRIAPLIVLGAFPIVLAGAALFAARHRDLGDGVVAVPASRPPRTRLLQSISGFALRRTARTTLGWATGIAAYFLLVGVLLSSILELFQTNPRFAKLAAPAGMGGHELVNVGAAVLFGVLAVPTGLYAASRRDGRRREGRSMDLAVRPTHFTRTPGVHRDHGHGGWGGRPALLGRSRRLERRQNHWRPTAVERFTCGCAEFPSRGIARGRPPRWASGGSRSRCRRDRCTAGCGRIP